MSAGSVPVRGALFVCVIAFLGAGAILEASPVSPTPSDAPFRLLWLSDLGAESFAAERATSRDPSDVVIARVPGAVYELIILEGEARKVRRLTADYSLTYGLSTSADGDVLLAGDDGGVSLWSRSGTAGGELSLGWHRNLEERAVSVGWDGGDDLWVATRDSRLMALSATDGEVRWSASLGGRADAPPVRARDALFVATKGRALLRLEAETGKTKWSVELPGPAIYSPTDAAGIVLASTWNGHLLAVDPQTGATLWSADLEARLAGAPVIAETVVAVPTEDGSVSAFDLEGNTLWRREGVADERTDLLVHGRVGEPLRLLAVSMRLSLLDVATGEIVNDYPAGAVADLEQRFLDVMLEGKPPYSETEKVSLLEQESFSIRGRLFGRAARSGDNLVFATEEGWVYWFDWESLRPVCRYRAGQRASDVAPVWAADRLIAPASEAVYGLDRTSGTMLWQREVGPVIQIVAADTLGIVGTDRLDVLDPETGARQWTARGAYASVAVSDDGWLAFERSGSIRLLDSFGTPGDASIAPLSSTRAVASVGTGLWAIASAEGELALIAWDAAAAPRAVWEMELGGSIESLSRADTTLVVSLGDRLAGLSILDGASLWELPVGEGETPLLDGHVFVATENALRLYEPVGGTLAAELEVEASVVGASLIDDVVVWLDTTGTAHRAPLEASEGAERESVPLGARLSHAVFENGNVLVTTDAGEIGLVELAPGRAQLSSTNDLLLEEKK